METNLNHEVPVQVGNKKYIIVTDNLNWVDATQYAKAKGGCLATIPDEATNVYLATQLRRLNLGGAYIGLTDQNKEGLWVWQSGSPLTYSKWATGEPNNNDHGHDSRGEDHVVMRANGEWNDYMGYAHGHAIPFIIEIP